MRNLPGQCWAHRFGYAREEQGPVKYGMEDGMQVAGARGGYASAHRAWEAGPERVEGESALDGEA